MGCNMEVLLYNMIVYDESGQDGLEKNGSQHENKLWNLIGLNESYWDRKELNGLQREGFSMKHDGR